MFCQRDNSLRGNVPPSGVRRDPSGDSARSGWSRHGSRRPDTNDSPGAPARATSPRPRLSIPRLWRVVRSRPSHPPLGSGRTYNALKSRDALPSPSPRRPRGGIPGGTTADGELRFTRPDGRPLPAVPPTSAVPDDPVRALRARNEAAGLQLNAQTTRPGWLWERLDVGYAISVLHPRARQPSVTIGE